MADILQTGISGLRASQRGLATTSHNISNVNTDGFSRQRVEQDSSLPKYFSRGAIGTGTQVQTIARMSEETRVDALRRNHTEYERLDTLQEMTGRIDNLVADPDAGLSPVLRGFFDAVEEVANDPSNTVAAQQLLTQGQTLVDRFDTLDRRLLDLGNDVNKRIEVQAEQVNGLAESIADLNNEIRRRWLRPERPPNDLLDRREEKIRELSELVEVRITHQDDLALNVAIGSGQPLVTGDRANEVQVVQNPYDPERPELAVKVGERELQVSQSIRGGTLGGLLEFRDDVLDKTRDELGRVATSVAAAFNEQHNRGVQFDAGHPLPGGDFFRHAEVSVARHPRNEGSERPEVVIDRDDIGGLTGQNYLLTQVDGDWVLRTEGHSEERALGLDIEADADGRYRVDGMIIAPPSDAADGDQFRIAPTREGAREVEVRLSRPTQVATAAPALTGEALNDEGQSINSGRGHISLPVVGDARGVMEALEEGGALSKGVTLEYVEEANGDSFFQVYVGGEALPGARLAYQPSDPQLGEVYNLSEVEGLEGLDIEIRLYGEPDTGDRFAVTGNYEGIGDNTNALRLAELAETGIMDRGNSTFQEAYSSMVGEVGAYSARVQTNRDAQYALLQQAEEAWESLSGVNLDEEAAKMMELQRSYQAAAQVITTADEIFRELLMAVRR